MEEIRNPTPVEVGSFFIQSPRSLSDFGSPSPVIILQNQDSHTWRLLPHLHLGMQSAWHPELRSKKFVFDISWGVPFPWFWDIWAVARTACWLAVETWIVKGGNTPLCWQTVWRKSAANLCTSHFLAISPDDLAILHVSLFQRVTSKKVNHKTYPQTST